MVVVSATQMPCVANIETNIANAKSLIRQAVRNSNSNIVLLQELFATLYFCQEQKSDYLKYAGPYSLENPLLKTFSDLAKDLHVVLPISFFEVANNVYFNSLTVIDVDGELKGLYRKSHIPDGPGYMEKFYFSPGDTGFKVFDTFYGRIGVAICWDQWFPEAARSMVLQGAEILLYPTAIGTEPQDQSLDSSKHWERVMVGHSAANMVPVIVSNRIGVEKFEKSEITFYGSSFITDNSGEVLQRANKTDRQIITEKFDLDEFKRIRHSWGLFRDRRPDLYGVILTKDGKSKSNYEYAN